MLYTPYNAPQFGIEGSLNSWNYSTHTWYVNPCNFSEIWAAISDSKLQTCSGRVSCTNEITDPGPRPLFLNKE